MADNKSKGKGANKNQLAQQRAQTNAALAQQKLAKPRTCCNCGGTIAVLGQLETVRLVANGKPRMRARHKGGCPQAS